MANGPQMCHCVRVSGFIANEYAWKFYYWFLCECKALWTRWTACPWYNPYPHTLDPPLVWETHDMHVWGLKEWQRGNLLKSTSTNLNHQNIGEKNFLSLPRNFPDQTKVCGYRRFFMNSLWKETVGKQGDKRGVNHLLPWHLFPNYKFQLSLTEGLSLHNQLQSLTKMTFVIKYQSRNTYKIDKMK